MGSAMFFFFQGACLLAKWPIWPELRDRSLFLWGGGGGIIGWARPIFFRGKGWAKREFHDDWGCVIVCKESHSLQFMWKI